MSSAALNIQAAARPATALCQPAPSASGKQSSDPVQDSLTKTKPGVAQMQRLAGGADGLPGGARAAGLGEVSCAGLGLSSIENLVCTMQLFNKKQNDATCRRAEGTVRDNLSSLEKENKTQREEIKKRIEAERNKGFWDSFVSFFTSIAKVVVGVASACTGGALGVVAGALSLVGFTVQQALKNQLGTYLNLAFNTVSGALSSAAGALNGGNAIDAVGKEAQQAADAVAAIPRGIYESRSLRARAAIQDSQARVENLRDDMDGALDKLRDAVSTGKRHDALVNRMMGQAAANCEAAAGNRI